MTAAPRHLLLTLAAALGLLACLGTAAQAQAAKRGASAPTLIFTRCSSAPFPCQGSHSVVTRTGRMLVGAGGMTSRSKVEFAIRSGTTGKLGKRRVGGSFRTRTRLLVRVPGDAVSGAIRVVNPGPKYSKALRITVVKPPPRVTKPPATSTPARPPSSPGRSVFDGSGMWIWYLGRAEQGDAAAIAARAARAGVRTIFLKSADGDDVWSQFTQAAVAELKATGLNVCGWQFVYGNDPIGEARAGAAAKAAGADCFVIDAEGAYEGKYAQAQRYVRALRTAVGDDYPVALTSFPYVHYHGGFPYSVFMGPGGATYNLPQVYWKTIGTSVDTSLATTYQYNSVYETPIYPLGQAYDGTAAADVRRFRSLSEGYGARGVSWWVWDYASASDWGAVGAGIAPIEALDQQLYPTLQARGAKTGSSGDLVVWAQQHLVGAGATIRVDGDYGPGTANAVRTYQGQKGIAQTGVLDAETWPALLAETPVTPDWVAQAARAARAARAAGGPGAAAARAASAAVAGPNGPRSASLRARRNEIPPGPPH